MEGYLEIFGRKFGGKKEDCVGNYFFGSGNTAVYINSKLLVHRSMCNHGRNERRFQQQGCLKKQSIHHRFDFLGNAATRR